MQGLALPRMGVNISAGSSLAAAGVVVVSSANAISWGMSTAVGAATITAQVGISGIQSISAGTTQITSGQVVLSNSNGVLWGMSGNTITAARAALSYWDNHVWLFGNSGLALPGPMVQRTSLAMPISATIANILNATGLSASLVPITIAWNVLAGEYLLLLNATQSSIQIGLYTMAGSTASLVSSGSTSLTQTLKPWGMMLLNDGNAPREAGGQVNHAPYFGMGWYSTGTLSPPASIQLSEIYQTNSGGSSGLSMPYVQIAGSI